MKYATPKRSRINKSAWMAGALLTLALVCLFVFQKPPPRTLHLKDGSVWRLEHLSVGTNHQHWIGKTWQRPLALLPVSLAEKLARKPLYMKWQSPEPSLMIYSGFLTSAVPRQLAFTIESGNLSSGAYLFDAQDRLFGFEITSWPRNAPYFDLVWTSDSRPITKLGSLRIKNPSPSQPIMRAQAPAQEAILGAITVKLDSLTVFSNQPVRIKLSVWENGKAAQNYAVHKWRLEDALGNKVDGRPGERPDHQLLLTSSPVWAPEHGWTIRGELVQLAGFTTNQLVTFTNVSLPSRTSGQQQLTAMSSVGPIILENATLRAPSSPWPGFVLRSASGSNIFPQILRVEGGDMILHDMMAHERGDNYAIFPLNFVEKRGDVTCSVVAPIPFALTAVPTRE